MYMYICLLFWYSTSWFFLSLVKTFFINYLFLPFLDCVFPELLISILCSSVWCVIDLCNHGPKSWILQNSNLEVVSILLSVNSNVLILINWKKLSFYLFPKFYISICLCFFITHCYRAWRWEVYLVRFETVIKQNCISLKCFLILKWSISQKSYAYNGPDIFPSHIRSLLLLWWWWRATVCSNVTEQFGNWIYLQMIHCYS